MEACIIQSILQPSQAKKNEAHQISDERSLLLLHKIANISTSLGLQKKKKGHQVTKYLNDKVAYFLMMQILKGNQEEKHKAMFRTVSYFLKISISNDPDKKKKPRPTTPQHINLQIVKVRVGTCMHACV